VPSCTYMGGCGQFSHAVSGEVYYFYSVSPEYFGYTLVHMTKLIVAFRNFANAPKKRSRHGLKGIVFGLLPYTLGYKDVCCNETSLICVSGLLHCPDTVLGKGPSGSGVRRNFVRGGGELNKFS
jgi:hypothetical protein